MRTEEGFMVEEETSPDLLMPEESFNISFFSSLCHFPRHEMSTFAGNHQDKIFSFWVEGVASLVIGIFGLLGNTVAINIWRKKEFTETFHKLLITLAVMDNIFIITAVFALTSRTFSLLRHPKLLFLNTIFMGMITLGSFAMATSMYLTLAISIERYFGICHPMQSRVGRRRRSFAYIVPVFLGSFLYTSPKLLEIGSGGEVNIELSDDPLYNMIYKQYCELFFTVIFPLLGLVAFNMKVYLTIRRVRKSPGLISTVTTKTELALAKVVISIVITFLVCQIPRIFLSFYRASVSKRTNFCWELGLLPTHPSWMFTLTALQHFFLIVNSSVNFIIYCVMGTKFRQVLMLSFKKMFCSTNNSFEPDSEAELSAGTRANTPKADPTCRQPQTSQMTLLGLLERENTNF